MIEVKSVILPKEVQRKRELANLFKEFDDVNLGRVVLYSVKDDEIADHVIDFFVEGSALIYPFKSYFVAIVYAACMVKYFPKYFPDVTDALKCSDLLDKDDFYVPYNRSTYKIYNSILNWFERERSEILSFSSTKKTHKYFKEEFLIDDKVINNISR